MDAPVTQILACKRVQQVRDVLASMGQSKPEVAALLRANGCRGVRGTSWNNPVSLYLKLKLGREVRIIGDMAGFATLPAPVRHFLTAYENMEYPDLEVAHA